MENRPPFPDPPLPNAPVRARACPPLPDPQIQEGNEARKGKHITDIQFDMTTPITIKYILCLVIVQIISSSSRNFVQIGARIFLHFHETLLLG